MIGNGHEFDRGRQFAAWLGLVPGQYSSGGKARLGRITKAGDPCLRSQLVMGARAVWRQRRTRPIRSAAGRWRCKSAAATGKRGGHRGQERAHGLGGAHARRRLRAAGMSTPAPIAIHRGFETDRRVTASVDVDRFGPAREVTD
jgi:hypothetical protein